jgi:hypothetical protein
MIKYSFILLAILFTTLFGCANCKKNESTSNNTEKIETMKETNILVLNVVEELNFNERNITFPMINASIENENENLLIKLKYGGGCKPHDFQLFTTNIPNQNNEINLYLADYTEDDHCRAFVLKSFTANIAQIYSPKFKYILNNSIALN